MRTWRVLTCSDSSMLERWSSSACTLRSCSCFASFLASAAESRPRRCSASSSASKSCTCNDYQVRHSRRFNYPPFLLSCLPQFSQSFNPYFSPSLLSAVLILLQMVNPFPSFHTSFLSSLTFSNIHSFLIPLSHLFFFRNAILPFSLQPSPSLRLSSLLYLTPSFTNTPANLSPQTTWCIL